jgi:hypothetical protein
VAEKNMIRYLLVAAWVALVPLSAHAFTWTNGIGDGATDNTSAWNAALAQCATGANGGKRIDAPAGVFAFLSQPNPVPDGCHIIGRGKVTTIFLKRFNGGIFFDLTGVGNGDMGLERFSILTDATSSPGYAVVLQGDATDQPDATVLRDLYVTSNNGGLWLVGLLVYGNARTSPQGVRGVYMENCDWFNASAATMYLSNVVGFTMVGGGAYQGDGPSSAAGIWVTGGGTPATTSTETWFLGVIISGQLNLTNGVNTGRFIGNVGAINADGSIAFSGSASTVVTW